MQEEAVMTFESLFTIIKEKLATADAREISGHVALEFQVRGEAKGMFFVEITNGRIRIEPYNYHDRDVSFAADADTYLEIINGKLDPMIAFAVGRVKIYGDMNKAGLVMHLL